MNITLAKKEDQARWNKFIEDKNLPPTMNFEWQDILKDSYDAESHMLIAEDADGICGILPFYSVKDMRSLNNLFSLQYGLVANSDTIAENLLSKATELDLTQNATEFTISSQTNKLNLDEKLKTTVVFELKKTKEETWDAFRDKTRNSIRKAEKEGITTEFGMQNLDAFYECYVGRMFEKDLGFHKREYFDSIIKHMGDSTQLVVAKYQGEVMGGMFFQHNATAAIYIFGGTAMFKPTSPNQLLLWEMTQFCIKKGLKILDLGESTKGGGVYQFKKLYCGKPKDIATYTVLLQKTDASFIGKVKGRSFKFLSKHSPDDQKKNLLMIKKSMGRLQ